MNFQLSQEGQEEAFFSQYLVNFINAPVFCLGVDAHFIYVNEAICEFLGYSRQELLSMTLADVMESSQTGTWLHQWQVIKQQDSYNFNCRLQTKDQKILSVKIAIAYIKEEDREFCCACIHQVEATSNPKTQLMDLTSTVSLLQSTFDSVAYGIIAISFEGQVLSYNRKFVQMWQIPESMTLSKDSQDCQDFFASKLKNPEILSYSVWDISRESAEETYDILELKDNRVFVQESKPLRQDNKIVGRVWSIWEINQERVVDSPQFKEPTFETLQTTELLQELSNTETPVEETQHLSELRARFFSTMCHQFRSFLNIISFSNGLLRRYVEQGAEKKKLPYLDNIQTAVEQISNLLDKLIFLGKSELGQLECKQNLTNVDELCRQLIVRVQPITDSKQQIIEYSSQGNCSTVLIDGELLEHILTNLLANASQYSPNNTKIEFSIDCEENQYNFKIRDRGIGIFLEEKQKIFEPFYRGSNVNNVSGSGLGLAIVKNLVAVHGGQIQVESEVNVGTTFTVIIPSLPSG